jgi:hypothetical protein
MRAQRWHFPMSPIDEHRENRRFALRLPVTICIPSLGRQQFETDTKDVSARGVYFYLDAPVLRDTMIELILTLPTEITMTDSISVRCDARIVRLDHDSLGKQVGVAAIFERYEFVASAGAAQ